MTRRQAEDNLHSRRRLGLTPSSPPPHRSEPQATPLAVLLGQHCSPVTAIFRGDEGFDTSMAVERRGTRIVATGCTSGLGAQAVKELVKTAYPSMPPPYHLILLARDVEADYSLRLRDELRAMVASLDDSVANEVELRRADLVSLASCRSAAKSILAELEAASHNSPPWSQITPGRIDVLLLNAASAKRRHELVEDEEYNKGSTSNAEALKDEQGRYEYTACVNHVSQQLIAAVLLPYMLMQPTSDSGQVPRVVYTGSVLHRRLKSPDDLEYFFNPRRNLSEKQGAITKSNDTAAQRRPWNLAASYGASKFLQVLGVQKVIQLLEQYARGSSDTRIDVVIVQPGFIPNTGLNREAPLLGRLFLRHVIASLPLPFVATIQEGAKNIADACARPLSSFAVSREKSGRQGHAVEADKTLAPLSAWLQAEAPVVDGVRRALIVRGGRRQAPDDRTFDPELMQRWWPEVVQHEWQRNTPPRKV